MVEGTLEEFRKGLGKAAVIAEIYKKAVFGKDTCLICVPNSCTWFIAIHKKGNIWRIMTEEEEKEWRRVKNEFV